MISYRNADIFERFRTKTQDIVFVFSIVQHEQWTALPFDVWQPIQDPNIERVIVTELPLYGSGFDIYYHRKKFDINQVVFERYKGEFNEHNMKKIHEIIDSFLEKMNAAGYRVTIEEDHIYKKEGIGSRYIVRFRVTKQK